MSKTIITIGRQYGSGGRDIGEKLAEMLKIPFYDRKLLKIASQNSGIDEEFFENNDEKPINSLLYVLSNSYTDDNLPFNHKIFLAQFETIRKIADEGSCVIVGRCADYALKDRKNVLNVYIHSEIEKRIKRAIENYKLPEKNAEQAILKIDKRRENYYNFYTCKKWGRAENYHLCIDSGLLGIDKSVTAISEFVKLIEE